MGLGAGNAGVTDCKQQQFRAGGLFLMGVRKGGEEEGLNDGINDTQYHGRTLRVNTLVYAHLGMRNGVWRLQEVLLDLEMNLNNRRLGMCPVFVPRSRKWKPHKKQE